MANNSVTTLNPQDGTTVSVVGDTYRILISGEQTQNAYAVIDMMIPPNGGPGPHSHVTVQEAFYVIEGEIEVTTEAETYTATKGAYVNIPFDGPVHQFKNNTDKNAHLICIVTPAGQEKFFEEIGKPVAQGEFLPPSEMTPELAEKMKAVREKYGNKMYPPDYFEKK